MSDANRQGAAQDFKIVSCANRWTQDFLPAEINANREIQFGDHSKRKIKRQRRAQLARSTNHLAFAKDLLWTKPSAATSNTAEGHCELPFHF